jgi:hypothetical protein
MFETFLTTVDTTAHVDETSCAVPTKCDELALKEGDGFGVAAVEAFATCTGPDEHADITRQTATAATSAKVDLGRKKPPTIPALKSATAYPLVILT